MSIAYLAAMVSCISMAVVYLTDMAMAGKTYSRPSQPMFVSSIFCFVPMIVLLLLLEWDNPPPISAMIMSFFSGVALMLANWFYFTVIYSDAGECTEVASFESASVLVVALFIAVLRLIQVPFHDVISSGQWFGVLLGGAALIAVHIFGDKMEYVDLRHRMMLVAFMFLGAFYELLIDTAIHITAVGYAETVNPDQNAYLHVSPFFWLGLTTGCVAMLPKKEWQAWVQNLPNLKQYWWTIAIVEGAAVIAFGAAVLGFAEGHVAVVALIAGAFPVLVLIGGVILRRVFEFDENTFPIVQHPVKKFIAVLTVLIGIVFASWN